MVVILLGQTSIFSLPYLLENLFVLPEKLRRISPSAALVALMRLPGIVPVRFANLAEPLTRFNLRLNLNE